MSIGAPIEFKFGAWSGQVAAVANGQTEWLIPLSQAGLYVVDGSVG